MTRTRGSVVSRTVSGHRPVRPRAAPDRQDIATRVGAFVIHSLEAGAGEPLVLLHGLSGSGRWWERNIDELALHHRVLIPDLIGYGRSRVAGRVPPLPAMADLLASWLEHLAIDSAAVVGHSMGGQLAIHFAARHPDLLRRLVLVDAAGIPRPVTPRQVARFAMEIAPVWRWGDPTFIPTIVGDAWTAGPRTVMRSIGHIIHDDVRPLLPRIEAPTLIIWGQGDSWVPLRHAFELRRNISDARLVIMRGAAHMPMVDRPDAFNRLVLRFLEGEQIGA